MIEYCEIAKRGHPENLKKDIKGVIRRTEN